MLKHQAETSVADAHAEQMINIYRAAQRQLEAHVATTLSSGAMGSHAYYERQLKMANLILGQLKIDQQAHIYQGIDKIYKAAGYAAFNAGGMGVQFGGVNQRAVIVLASAMNAKVDGALTLVGRRIEDAFRNAALKEVAGGLAASATRAQVSSALEQRLIKKGITDSVTGFVDKGGRRWSLEAYTRMVARTTTREAVTSAVVDQIQQAGEDDLISISEHSGASDECSIYEGQTFSLYGKTPGYDVIDQLPPFHPNCIHTAFPASATFDRFEQQLKNELENPTPIPEQPGAPAAKLATGGAKAEAKAAAEAELQANDQALWNVSKLGSPPAKTYGNAGIGSHRDFYLDESAAKAAMDGTVREQRLPSSARIAELDTWPTSAKTGAKMTEDELVTAVKRSGYDGYRATLATEDRVHLWRKTNTEAKGAVDHHKFTGGRPQVPNPSPDIQALKKPGKVTAPAKTLPKIEEPPIPEPTPPPAPKPSPAPKPTPAPKVKQITKMTPEQQKAADQAVWKVTKLSSPPKALYAPAGEQDFVVSQSKALDISKAAPDGSGPAVLEHRLPANTRLAEFNAYDWPINPATGAKMTQDELVASLRRSGYDGFKVNHPDGGRVHLFRKTSTTPNKSGKAISYHKFTGGRPQAVNEAPQITAAKTAPKPEPEIPVAPPTPKAPSAPPAPAIEVEQIKPNSVYKTEDVEKIIDEHIAQQGTIPTMKILQEKGVYMPKASLQKYKAKYPEKVQGLKTAKNTASGGAKSGGITGRALATAAKKAQAGLDKIFAGPQGSVFTAPFRSYCGSGYREINIALRRLAKGESPQSIASSGSAGASAIQKIERMNEVFSHPAAQHDYRAKVFRSVNRRDGGHYTASVKDLKVGSVHVEDGYGSTTMRESFAVNWSQGGQRPDLWEIDAPPGWRGISVNAHKLSSHANEQEILFPPGTRMKVLEITETTINGKKWRRIRARVIVGV